MQIESSKLQCTLLFINSDEITVRSNFMSAAIH